jgi:hypothetical protein
LGSSSGAKASAFRSANLDGAVSVMATGLCQVQRRCGGTRKRLAIHAGNPIQTTPSSAPCAPPQQIVKRVLFLIDPEAEWGHQARQFAGPLFTGAGPEQLFCGPIMRL